MQNNSAFKFQEVLKIVQSYGPLARDALPQAKYKLNQL